ELDRLLGDLSARREENKERLTRLATALSAGDILGVCSSMYNIFEEVVLPARPLAARAKEILLSCGAAGAMLSGSGPTVFGIFTDAAAQKSAAAALRAAGYRPIAAQSAPQRENQNRDADLFSGYR
ncbi:MAG: hypothetical protein IJU41_01320, partial [Clostridia bacterium]|nr:hypothetical protein [Clostridia bacterium]